MSGAHHHPQQSKTHHWGASLTKVEREKSDETAYPFPLEKEGTIRVGSCKNGSWIFT